MRRPTIGAPSSAHVWGFGGCTAYPHVRFEYPAGLTSPAAEEGRAAHAAAERMIMTGEAPDLGSFELDAAVFEYVEFCAGLMGSAESFGVETRVHVPRVHKDSNGMVDFWAYDAATMTLHIVDFKAGFNYVSEVDNPQLIMYASGLIEKLGLCDLKVGLSLTIVQPRAFGGGPIRSQVVHAVAIRGIINQLNHAAHMSEDPATAERKAGTHCRKCPDLHKCEAAAKLAGELYSSAMEYSPADITPGQLGRALSDIAPAAKFLEQLHDAIREEAKIRMGRGERVHGWELASRKSPAQWVTESPETTLDMFGVDIRKPAEVMTPAQTIVQLKKAGLPPEAIDGLAQRPAPSHSLKKINLTKYQEVFSHGSK